MTAGCPCISREGVNSTGLVQVTCICQVQQDGALHAAPMTPVSHDGRQTAKAEHVCKCIDRARCAHVGQVACSWSQLVTQPLWKMWPQGSDTTLLSASSSWQMLHSTSSTCRVRPGHACGVSRQHRSHHCGTLYQTRVAMACRALHKLDTAQWSAGKRRGAWLLFKCQRDPLRLPSHAM